MRLTRFYKKYVKGQLVHKLLTYSYLFLFEGLARVVGRNNAKNFLRHSSKLAFMPMRLKLKNGLVINHFLESYGLLIELIYMDEYEIENIPDGIIIDVGANIGLFSLLCAKGKKVYAFEPEKKNFKMLITNIKENKLVDVFPSKIALSKSKGRTRLFIHGSATHSLYRQNKDDTFENVETATLDSIFLPQLVERISLLKIDVEGAELDVLEGCKQLLKKTDNIILEKVSSIPEDKILKLLAGFKLVKKKGALYFFSR
ncbi:MAG: FkbM family methyltransferase [archaeon]